MALIDAMQFPHIHPILHQMPFLSQPSQFILAKDRHQICWIAYLETWLHILQKIIKIVEDIASQSSVVFETKYSMTAKV